MFSIASLLVASLLLYFDRSKGNLMSSAISPELTTSTALITTNQCSHINGAGRRCRMIVAPTHDELCAHHFQQHVASQPDPETLAAELLETTGNLNTADRVNALLANVVKQLARKRIDRRDALAIGYLAQLLLNTVPGVQKEYQAIRASEARQALRKSFAEAQAARHAASAKPSRTIPESQIGFHATPST
jgi:hypothetical protein